MSSMGKSRHTGQFHVGPGNGPAVCVFSSKKADEDTDIALLYMNVIGVCPKLTEKFDVPKIAAKDRRLENRRIKIFRTENSFFLLPPGCIMYCIEQNLILNKINHW